MSKTEKIQQLINWLNESNDEQIIMMIPKGLKSAAETMSKKKILLTCGKKNRRLSSSRPSGQKSVTVSAGKTAHFSTYTWLNFSIWQKNYCFGKNFPRTAS